MTTNSIRYKFVLPVLMSFFVMSFVDMVGIGVDRVKMDFGLSDTLAQLIPSAAFLWFLLLLNIIVVCDLLQYCFSKGFFPC